MEAFLADSDATSNGGVMLLCQAGRALGLTEQAARGANPRYIVTNLKGTPRQLYDKMYCALGNMENWIKQQQMDLFTDCTSCSEWWPNRYRILLSSMACVLLDAILQIGLVGSELAHAYVGTLRLKLLKIGTVVLRNTRHVRQPLSSSYPNQPARAISRIIVRLHSRPLRQLHPEASVVACHAATR